MDSTEQLFLLVLGALMGEESNVLAVVVDSHRLALFEFHGHEFFGQVRLLCDGADKLHITFSKFQGQQKTGKPIASRHCSSFAFVRLRKF